MTPCASLVIIHSSSSSLSKLCSSNYIQCCGHSVMTVCPIARAHLSMVYATASEPSSVCAATSSHPLGHSFSTNTAYSSTKLPVGYRWEASKPRSPTLVPYHGRPFLAKPQQTPQASPKARPCLKARINCCSSAAAVTAVSGCTPNQWRH